MDPSTSLSNLGWALARCGGGEGNLLARLYFWLWFGLVWFGWVGLVRYVHISYRIVSGLCLARKRRETRLQSPRRFVLCDHHYLRFAASFYGVRVKREGGIKGAVQGRASMPRNAAGASLASPPPPTTICLKPQPFFNIQR